MKEIIAILLLGLLAGCATVQTAQVDADYVLALSTANRFLEAWRIRDQDAGLALLSPRLRKSQAEDEWRMAISGCSNPHHQSYEITGGRRLPDGRIQFDVWLHDHYTGQRYGASPRNAAEHIILIELEREQWRVDDTPQL